MTPRTPRHRADDHPTYAPMPASWAVGMYTPRTEQGTAEHYSFGAGAL